MRSAALLVPLVALGLAACGDVPQPFRPDDGAPASALVRPPSAARVVVATRGLPAEHAPQSETLNEAVAEALRTADLPATSRPQGRPDLLLLVRAIAEEPQSRIEISVTDADGQAQASPPDPISVAHAELISADPAVQAQLAARIARLAVPLIRSAETSRRAQVLRQSIEPAAAGARVAVLGVSGAPGDGNVALARQMVDALRRKGIIVQDEPAGAHFLIRAEVRLAPAQGAQQPVEIIWRVSRGDGAQAGEVAQNNTVPAGTLDRYWGDVAFAVAAAAVDGVVQVMERTQADLPDWMRRAHGAPMSVAGAMPAEAASRGGLPPMGQIGDGRSGLMPPGMPGTSDDASFGAPAAAMTQPNPGDINSGVPVPRWARAAGAGQANGAPEEVETLVPSRVVPLVPGGIPGLAGAPMQPVGAVQLPPGFAAAQLPAGAAPAPAGIPPGYVVVYTNQGPMLVPGSLPPGFVAVPLPGAPNPATLAAAATPAGTTSFPAGATVAGGPPPAEAPLPAAGAAAASEGAAERAEPAAEPAMVSPALAASDSGPAGTPDGPASAAAGAAAAPSIASLAPVPAAPAFQRRPPTRGLAARPPTPEPAPVPPPPAGASIQPGAATGTAAPSTGPLLRAPSLSAPRPAAARPSASIGPGAPPGVEPAPVPSPLSLRTLGAAAEAGADQTRSGQPRR